MYVEAFAYISQDKLYRYVLSRRWHSNDPPYVLWVMLNPSTADGVTDDATVRRCVDFSRLWGYGAMTVVNLFAYRARDPLTLKSPTVENPVGPDNDETIRSLAPDAAMIIAAWGSHGTYRNRDVQVMSLLKGVGAKDAVRCLGLSGGGMPRHPLYVRRTVKPIRFCGTGRG